MNTKKHVHVPELHEVHQQFRTVDDEQVSGRYQGRYIAVHCDCVINLCETDGAVRHNSSSRYPQPIERIERAQTT